MIWQDIVITLANILMGYAIVPQIIHFFKTKKSLALQTTSLTVIGLIAMISCFFTLRLYLSFGITILTTILWTILLIQSIIYKKQ